MQNATTKARFTALFNKALLNSAILIMLNSVAVAQNLENNQSNKNDNQWSIWKQSNGLSIKTRTSNINSLTEIKAELTVSNSTKGFIALINKESLIPQWLDNTKSAKLTMLSPTYSELTVNFKPIWFTRPRQMTISSSINYMSEQQVVINVKNRIPAPENKNYIAITVHKAQWHINQQSDGTLHVSYQFIMDANGNSPRWITDKFQLNSTWRTIKNLQRLANQAFEN